MDGNEQVLNSLFITCVSPFRAVRGDTIQWWCNNLLHEAGITAKYSVSDLRAACTTKLANCRFTLTELLTMGRWAQQSDFYKYYLKSIVSQKKAKNAADFIAVDKARTLERADRVWQENIGDETSSVHTDATIAKRVDTLL